MPSEGTRRPVTAARESRPPAIRIEPVLVRDLESFADRAVSTAHRGTVVPISLTRARAWARNPNAEPDDVALLVASVDGRCAGHLGLVAGRLWDGHVTRRVHWLSALYVQPVARRFGLGALMVLEARKLGYLLGVTGASAESGRLYERLGFLELPALRYYELDLLRWNFGALPFRAVRRLLRLTRHRKSPLLEAGIAAANAITRSFVVSLLARAWCSASANYRAVPLEEIPDDWFDSDHLPDAAHCCRDKAVLHWMRAWPWATTDASRATPGCFFTDCCDALEYGFVQVDEPGAAGLTAVLWFVAREGVREVHVLDVVARTAQPGPTLARVGLEEAARRNADTLVLPAVCGGFLARSVLARSLTRARIRRSFLRPPGRDRELPGALRNLEVRYPDGEIAFA